MEPIDELLTEYDKKGFKCEHDFNFHVGYLYGKYVAYSHILEIIKLNNHATLTAEILP